jgi:hypothetical protein
LEWDWGTKMGNSTSKSPNGKEFLLKYFLSRPFSISSKHIDKPIARHLEPFRAGHFPIQKPSNLVITTYLRLDKLQFFQDWTKSPDPQGLISRPPSLFSRLG